MWQNSYPQIFLNLRSTDAVYYAYSLHRVTISIEKDVQFCKIAIFSVPVRICCFCVLYWVSIQNNPCMGSYAIGSSSRIFIRRFIIARSCFCHLSSASALPYQFSQSFWQCKVHHDKFSQHAQQRVMQFPVCHLLHMPVSSCLKILIEDTAKQLILACRKL